MTLAIHPEINVQQRIADMGMTQEEILDDTKGIPINDVKRAYDFFPYGSPERVMLAIRFITGCRGSELDNMKPGLFLGGVIYWPLGKKQRTFRKAPVPPWLRDELCYMRNNYPCRMDRLFPITNESFRRYFNMARKDLGGEWTRKKVKIRNGKPNLEYKYNLSGLRKNYQTLLFKKKLEEWGDAHVALQFTQKEMRHKSDKITAYHYLEDFHAIGADTVNFRDLPNLLRDKVQKRLLDY